MITEPSSFSAAKATYWKILLTPEEREEATADESPPWDFSPQVMTEPLSFSAANAYPVEKIWLTPEGEKRHQHFDKISLIGNVEGPQVMTEPSSFSAAKASSG